MPTYTSPDNIFKLAVGDTASDVAESQAQGDSIQTALSLRGQHSFVWANQTAQTAQAGMLQGDFGYRTDTGMSYQYVGSVWRRYSSLDWIGYVPALSTASSGTWTIGNGSLNAQWRPINGQTIMLQVLITIGSTTSMTGGQQPFVGLPTGLFTTSYTQIIPMEINSAGIGPFVGEGYMDGGTNVIQPKAPTSSGTSTISNLTSTQMGNGTTIRMNGSISVTGL